MSRCQSCGKNMLFSSREYCKECEAILESIREQDAQKEREKQRLIKEREDKRKLEEGQKANRMRLYRNQRYENGRRYEEAQMKPFHFDLLDMKESKRLMKMAHECEYVVFDTETTGLNPVENEIIELGAIKVRNGEIVDEFHSYISPIFGMNMDAMEINHITWEMVSNQPHSSVVLPKFLEFIKDAYFVIGHNVEFDAKFLLIDILGNGISPEDIQFIDTLKLARSLWKVGPKNYKLKTLADFIEYGDFSAHNALGDVKATNAIFIALCDEVNKVAKKNTRTEAKPKCEDDAEQ